MRYLLSRDRTCRPGNDALYQKPKAGFDENGLETDTTSQPSRTRFLDDIALRSQFTGHQFRTPPNPAPTSAGRHLFRKRSKKKSGPTYHRLGSRR